MTERVYQIAAAPFEAARRVEILPDGHPGRRLHGHSFRARVRAAVPPGWAPTGIGGFPGGEADALTATLTDVASAFDYQDLNQLLTVPTDENLARLVRDRLLERDVPGIESVGIRSTVDQGADLDGDAHCHVWRRFRFEAAHRLPNVPEGHQCGRMHGHGFEVILHADQDLPARGIGHDMGVDFERLAAVWAPLHAILHLGCLNDLPGLENPTSELLAAWLWTRIRPELPTLSWITVYETGTAGCHFDGERYRIWKDRRFESALALTRAPDGDPRRRLHGHSYLLRLHLTAPLDRVMGWTVDYGDVKALFEPVYRRLDHHRLDELHELASADPSSLVHWIRAQSAPALPWLCRIDLEATPGCGTVLCWGGLGPALPS
jgi:6-pyruvoyltetrahydropterin/6-carboxytetrahydropterin synthase